MSPIRQSGRALLAILVAAALLWGARLGLVAAFGPLEGSRPTLGILVATLAASTAFALALAIRGARAS